MTLEQSIRAADLVHSAAERSQLSILAIIHEQVARKIRFTGLVVFAIWKANQSVKGNVLSIAHAVGDTSLFDRVMLFFPLEDGKLQLSPNITLTRRGNQAWKVFEKLITFARSLSKEEVLVVGNNLTDKDYYNEGGGAQQFSDDTDGLYRNIPIVNDKTPKTDAGIVYDLTEVINSIDEELLST